MKAAHLRDFTSAIQLLGDVLSNIVDGGDPSSHPSQIALRGVHEVTSKYLTKMKKAA